MRPTGEERLELGLEYVDGYPCVRMSGESGREGAGVLRDTIQTLLNEGHTDLVLDTRDLRFLDLRCCSVLEEAAERLEEEGGQLVVVDQSLPVERTLKLLSVEHRVQVLPTISQATHYLDRND